MQILRRDFLGGFWGVNYVKFIVNACARRLGSLCGDDVFSGGSQGVPVGGKEGATFRAEGWVRGQETGSGSARSKRQEADFRGGGFRV